MAIDLVQTAKDLAQIQALTTRLIILVETTRRGKFSVEGIDVPFSQNQREGMVGQYKLMKKKLASLVQGLP